MEELRDRLNTAMWLSYGEQVFRGTAQFVMEAQMLQLRMCLELLAFSTLVANQERYSEVRAQFESDWKAARMLAVLEKVNPDFYPKPVFLKSHSTGPPGRSRADYQVLKDGYLTRDDFLFLYDVSSEILHSRNPFNQRTSVEIKYDLPIWVERIRQLLRIHCMHFVDDRRWLIYVPDSGKVEVFTVMSDPSVI
jgi:hypothetical protein